MPQELVTTSMKECNNVITDFNTPAQHTYSIRHISEKDMKKKTEVQLHFIHVQCYYSIQRWSPNIDIVILISSSKLNILLH